MEEVAAALGQAMLDAAVAASVALLRDFLAMWLSGAPADQELGAVVAVAPGALRRVVPATRTPGAAADEVAVDRRQAVPEASNRDRNRCNRWHGLR